MGADIHVRVEYKPYGERSWVDGDFYRRNRWHKEFKEEREYEVVPIYDGRNYMLFSLLADVRNDGLIEPICQPKGVPEDCCESVKKDIEYWDVDGHSHSYFTLAELIKWHSSNEHKVRVRGFVSPTQARALDEEGKAPTMWCGWTSEKDWVEREWKVDIDLLEPIIAAMKRRAVDLFYGSQGHEEDIRIVFWFDN